jgi:hypothetical protein
MEDRDGITEQLDEDNLDEANMILEDDFDSDFDDLENESESENFDDDDDF